MPQQPKPKSNLIAFLKRFRKPQPTKQEIMLMTKLMDLIAQVKLLVAKLTEAREEIIALKSALLAKDIQADKDEAAIAELMAVVNGVLDEGGSTGGVVG
jgi:hypothetical protein